MAGGARWRRAGADRADPVSFIFVFFFNAWLRPSSVTASRGCRTTDVPGVGRLARERVWRISAARCAQLRERKARVPGLRKWCGHRIDSAHHFFEFEVTVWPASRYEVPDLNDGPLDNVRGSHWRMCSGSGGNGGSGGSGGSGGGGGGS